MKPILSFLLHHLSGLMNAVALLMATAGFACAATIGVIMGIRLSSIIF